MKQGIDLILSFDHLLKWLPFIKKLIFAPLSYTKFPLSLDLFVFFLLVYLFIHVPTPQCLSHRAFTIQCALGRARSFSSFVGWVFFFHFFFPDYLHVCFPYKL